MIKIALKFYDKETEFLVEDIRLDLPEKLIFDTTNSTNIDKINALMFDVSLEMREHIIKHYPELEEKFKSFDFGFIGRHGLGEGY